MGALEIAIIVIVGVAFFAVVGVTLYKKLTHKGGGCGCGCDCCPHCTSCKADKRD